MISILVLLPLAGGAVALIAEGLHLRRVSPVAAFTVLGAAIVGVLGHTRTVLAGTAVVENIGGWGEPVGIALRLDGVAWIGVVTVLVVALLIYLYGQGQGGYTALFTFFYLMAVAGMVGLMVSTDLFNLFVCFEILSLSAYMLIAYKRKPRAIYAGFRYLVIGTIGMSLYLLGVFVVYRETGALSVSAVAAAGEHRAASPALVVAVAAMIAGIGTRVAFFPFHIWLPEAHSQAPHPVSALLSGVMIKAGFLTLFRIMAAFPAVPVAAVFEILGPVTALLGVLLALAQSDMKRLLAFHSVSQMGYILAGFAIAGTAGPYSELAATGAIYHMINHALFKSLLFLSIGVVITTTGERNLYRVSGLARRLPLTTLCFAVAAAAICGIPPFNGFASKAVLSAALKHSDWYIVLRIASVGTVASFVKLSRVFRAGAGGFVPADCTDASGFDRPAAGKFSQVVLATLCIALGLYPGFWTWRLGALTAGVVTTAGAQLGSANVFGLSGVLHALMVAAIGTGVYALLLRPVAAAGIRMVRLARLGIDLSVLTVLYGFTAIAVMIWLLLT